MSFPAPMIKGVARFGEFETWYRITGPIGAGTPPVVALHGGPGSTHDYLLRLCALTEAGWPVVHYDQLGNGRSSHLRERGPDFWTVQLFLDELDNLLTQLGIDDDYVLFGQSWGGMLGAAHAARQPAGLRGLVIANSPASMPLWLAEVGKLREELPPEVQRTLLRHEAARTTDTAEYQAAMKVFYDRHVCRVPWPVEVKATFLEIYNDPTVYETMNGPSEFHVIGTLKDWSVAEGLADITVPTLLISGRHDEATPGTVQPFADGIKNVRWEIFEESSHMPHVEEPERFTEVMLEFLAGL
jgi:L-proline amide hydrolase